jgi:hypothetical protein
MANNRMYLICLHCLHDDSKSLEDCRHYMAKYYPTDGWYASVDPEAYVERMNKFFEAHLHKETWHQAMFGDHFTLGTESLFQGDAMVSGKRGVLEAVQKAFFEGKLGQ